jgi:hypothetical protein
MGLMVLLLPLQVRYRVAKHFESNIMEIFFVNIVYAFFTQFVSIYLPVHMFRFRNH